MSRSSPSVLFTQYTDLFCDNAWEDLFTELFGGSCKDLGLFMLVCFRFFFFLFSICMTFVFQQLPVPKQALGSSAGIGGVLGPLQMLPQWDESTPLPNQLHLRPQRSGRVGGRGPVRGVDSEEGRVATMTFGSMICSTSVITVTALKRASCRSTKAPPFKMCTSSRRVNQPEKK